MFMKYFLLLFYGTMCVFDAALIEIISSENEVTPRYDDILDEKYFFNDINNPPKEIFYLKNTETVEKKDTLINFRKFFDYNFKPKMFSIRKKLPMHLKSDYRGLDLILKPMAINDDIKYPYSSSSLNNAIFDPIFITEKLVNVILNKMGMNEKNLLCNKNQKQIFLSKCNIENPLLIYNRISKIPASFNNHKAFNSDPFTKRKLENHVTFHRALNVYFNNNNINSNRINEIRNSKILFHLNKKINDKRNAMDFYHSKLQVVENNNFKQEKLMKKNYSPLINKILHSINVFKNVHNIKSEDFDTTMEKKILDQLVLLPILINHEHCNNEKSVNSNSFLEKKEQASKINNRSNTILHSKIFPLFETNNIVTKSVSPMKSTRKLQRKEEISKYFAQ